VSDPDAPPLNAGAILRALIDHQVDFVLVGGRAAQGHGAIRPTKDLDICPAWNDANLARVIAALRHLGAQMKTAQGGGMGTQPSVRMLRKMEITTWRTTAGDVDVLLGIPKGKNWQLAQYRQLNENAAIFDIGGQEVLIASLEDIIRSKEIANRPADHAALPELRELLARQQANAPAHDTSAQSRHVERPEPPSSAGPRAASPPRPYGTQARPQRPDGPQDRGLGR